MLVFVLFGGPSRLQITSPEGQSRSNRSTTCVLCLEYLKKKSTWLLSREYLKRENMCAGGIRTHIPRIQAPISCLCPMSFPNKSVGFPVPLKLRSSGGSGCTSWRRQEVQLSTSSNLPDHLFLLIYI